jgi:hypothetical protein
MVCGDRVHQAKAMYAFPVCSTRCRLFPKNGQMVVDGILVAGFILEAPRARMLAHGVTGSEYLVKDKCVWDTRAVRAPGARWENGTGVKPDSVGASVAYVSDQLAGYVR